MLYYYLPSVESESLRNIESSRQKPEMTLPQGLRLRASLAHVIKFLGFAEGLAGVPGLEPGMTESESAVLPITPYPNFIYQNQTRTSISANSRLLECLIIVVI